MSTLFVGAVPRAGASQQDYRELLCQYTDWDCAKAYRVLLCESTGDPNAYSAGNHGLMQVSGIHSAMVGGDVSRLYDPETNIRIAHQLWLERGWAPWGAVCGNR